MTTKRLYCCNLCGEYIDPDKYNAKITDKGGGFGLLFQGLKVKIVRTIEAEHHVCAVCYNGIGEAWKESNE